MTFTRSFLFIVTILFSISNINAQSTLINALPLEYNPSFAGSAGVGRLSYSGYLERQDYAFLNTNHSYRYGYSSGISYDQFIPKIKSGLGVSVNYSNGILYQAHYPYQSYNLNANKLVGGLAISPKFSVNGRYTISPSIQGLAGTNENTDGGNNQGGFVKLRAGVLLNAKKFYVGYSFDVFNYLFGKTKYETYYILDYSNLNNSIGPLKHIYRSPFCSNLQFGFSTQKNEESKFSYNPSLILYFNQYRRYNYSYKEIIFNKFVVNQNFRFKHILWGILMGNERIGIMMGYQNKNLKLIYVQYGIGYFGGQISFRYLFNTKSSTRSSIPSN